MSYKYTIVDRPGIQNRFADALTRLDFEKEMDLEQFLNQYGGELDLKTIRAITRSGLCTVGEPKKIINNSSIYMYVSSPQTYLY